MLYLALFAILAVSPSAYTFEPSKMKPAARTYYECMMRNSAAYARKALSTDEAIEAAIPLCRQEREATVLESASYTMEELRSKGLNPNPSTVLAGATEGVDEADRIIRPNLVRNVLDAK